MPISDFQRIPIKYTGLYSDDHIMDLQELGVSMQGLGKLANSVFNFHLSGKIVPDSRKYQVRLFMAPPEPGCVLFDIVAIITNGQLPLYAPLLSDLASLYVVPFIKAIVLKRLGRTDMTERLIEHIVEQARTREEFARAVHDGHMRDKSWLQAHIDTLTKTNTPALRQLVDPVGSTCKEILVGNSSPEQTQIGEAEAKVISAKEQLTVEDSREYRGIFEAVDTLNGNCKFLELGTTEAVLGRITDPALLTAENLYTHSLDAKQAVRVQAKAVKREGELVRLFISNGSRD